MNRLTCKFKTFKIVKREITSGIRPRYRLYDLILA